MPLLINKFFQFTHDRKDFLVFLFFLILGLIFFFPVLFLGKAFFIDDIERYFYPLRNLMYQMGQNKSIFLWNPYFFSGSTLIGNVESALFYPLNWIFFFIKTEKAISIYIYIHFLMAGFFAYLYLRNLGMRRISSLIGGILYSYSGFFILHIIHLTLIGVAAWFPLTLLFLDKFFKEKHFYYIVLAGLSFGLSCLCCSPFMIYLHILLIMIYFIFQVNFKRLMDVNNFRNLSAFIIIFLFGLSFSAIQIIPMFESSKYSIRMQGLLYEFAKIGSLKLKTLLMFLIPDYLGHPIYNHSYKGSYFFWEECYFVGIFSIILAVLGVILTKKSRNNFFLFLGISSLIMALGENTPLFPFMYKYLPYLNFFRVPARFAFFSVFSIVYFSSLGVEAVLESLESKDKEIKILKVITVLSLVFLITLPFLIKGAYSPLSLGVIFYFICGILGIFIIYLIIFKHISSKIFSFIVILLIIINLWSFDFTWNPTVPAQYYDQTVLVLKKYVKPQDGRIINYPPLNFKEKINLGAAAQLSNIVGYCPIVPKDYVEYLVYNEIGKIPSPKIISKIISFGNCFPVENINSNFIKLLNVNYKIDSQEVKENGLIKLLFKFKKLPDKIPYVFFVSRYKVIKEKDKLLKELASNEFNPKEEILFQEDPPKAFKNLGSLNNNSVRVIKNIPDKIELEAQVNQDGFIFISEIFYPGWKVFIDGAESKILKANYIFRAVLVNKGNHSIVFAYKPASFKIGLVISIFSLLTFIFISFKYFHFF